MMDYIDENILKAKHQQEEAKKQATSEENINKENSQSIYDDLITIYGIPVVFEDRNIIQDYASIRMPNDFTERTPEEIASVYFHGSRPQYVFSNEYLPFMLALNWTSNMISNEKIIDFANVAKTLIQRVGPKSRILKSSTLKREEGNLSILQFTAQTLESINMNIMFFASIENRLLIGSITFQKKDANRLQPIALEMAKSFHLLHKKGKEEK